MNDESSWPPRRILFVHILGYMNAWSNPKYLSQGQTVGWVNLSFEERLDLKAQWSNYLVNDRPTIFILMSRVTLPVKTCSVLPIRPYAMSEIRVLYSFCMICLKYVIVHKGTPNRSTSTRCPMNAERVKLGVTTVLRSSFNPITLITLGYSYINIRKDAVLTSGEKIWNHIC